MTAAADRADRLRALHVPGTPVILPNAWDAATARAVVAAGFPAVATASAAMAPALGYDDAEGTPPDEVFAALARITRAVDVPVTADVERGYRLPPAQIGARLAEAGAIGCNLEDSDPATGQLVPVEDQVALLAGVRAAAPHLVVNARVDVFLHGAGSREERIAEAVRRGRAYVEAGADCVYPLIIDRLDPAEVRQLVDGIGAPVNVAFLPGGPSLRELADAGVARVSFGPGLFRLLQGVHEAALAAIAAGDSPYPGPGAG
ncbi:isocitrate lyase/phosphoenolpyruvate mutase family protein [Pseudonocardia zijingensis]|uniref:Isocitrate lyase/phosphoenolpyruvate mutase family protein n=1 Tax=Pseudonocardia zijingensis TaxID=153376 RepID=A0ABN1NDU2_9PSEU